MNCLVGRHQHGIILRGIDERLAVPVGHDATGRLDDRHLREDVVVEDVAFNEEVDAFTAMGTSMALVWNNLPVMLTWGCIVLALFVVSLLTGTLGLVLVFPLVGHATWHAYKAIRIPA